MSEAGFSQTLVNPKTGFRHSDPESTHGIYGNPHRVGITKAVIPSRISEATKAVIPGGMSEAGFSQTLVNPKTGFRHSDPESTHGIYGNPHRVGITKAVIPSRMSEATKAVIPGRMSEAGFSQTLVNPETGFRHSDPESTHGIYGNPHRVGITKAVIPSRMSEATKAVIPGGMSEAGFSQTLVSPKTGFRHSDPESTHGICGNPHRVGVAKAVIPGIPIGLASPRLSFRAGCRKPVFPRPWLTRKPASGILTRNPHMEFAAILASPKLSEKNSLPTSCPE
ncbi:hypothetical protein QUF72_05405 [Desulfobacterales bacterium HSG2]|nr:hypothetical protein [Desulfobacterales bacterium HSG2]